MRGNVANAFKGGLVAGATVMGVDSVVTPGEAATLTPHGISFQLLEPPGNCRFLDCCYDTVSNPISGFTFPGFDTSLGTLTEVRLTVQADSFTDIELIVSGELDGTALNAGNFVPDGSTGLVDLGDILPGSSLDFTQTEVLVPFSIALFTVGFSPDSEIGQASLTYSFDAANVPIPAAALYAGTSLLAMLAVGGVGRRRRLT